MSGHVQYVGFVDRGPSREYRLRFWPAGGEPLEFTVVIAAEAFATRRVRYQDAPEVCFLKLQNALAASAASAEALPAALMKVTDAELEEYRVAHSPKPPQRRPRPPRE